MSDASSLAQALALFRAGDLVGAERALTPVDMRAFDAVHLLAGVKRARGDEAGALTLFDAAIALKPESAAAQNNRAGLLLALGRFAEAADAYRIVLALRPSDADAAYNRARALAMLERHADAADAYAAAARLRPDQPDIAVDHGAALQALGRTDEALVQFQRALALAPDHAGGLRGIAALRYNEGVALLRAGNFARGFTLYEQRRAAGVIDTPDAGRDKPAWRGEDLAGVLHVWPEMGVGEQVLFASLLPLAHARAARIVLECDGRLAPLLARSLPFLEKVQDVRAQVPIAAAAQISLASLPHALGLAPDALSDAPYLHADSARTAALRARYEALAQGRPIVGIAWFSKNAVFGDRKSSHLEDWGALLGAPYFFVNLQYGDVDAELAQARERFDCEIFADPEIDQMRDLDGFAAQIAALDSVVSVSNTTVHLAGALGAPCLVLLPEDRRVLWYWGDAGERSLRYRSLILVAHEQGWAEQVARAAALLRDVLAAA